MRALPRVIEQHALEAAILWRLRDQATVSPRGSLTVLERFDRRVEAHLDGLRVAGDDGWLTAWAGVTPGRAESVFPVAWLALDVALDGETPERVEAVLELADPDPEALRGLEAALDWIPFDRLWRRVEGWLASPLPARRRLALAACRKHRRDPFGAVDKALEDDDMAVRTGALVAAGRLGRIDLMRRLRGAWPSCDEAVRWSAARASARLGDAAAAAVLRELALAGAAACEEAACLAARTLPPAAGQALVRELGEVPATARAAVVAAGDAGLPELVAWLIERMDEPSLARAAGAALERITGIPISADDPAEPPLAAPAPPGFQAGPTDDPADPAVAMDPDAGRPFPAPGPVADGWLRVRHRFVDGHRYLAGEPVASADLDRWLAEGSSPLRRAAALERKLRVPGEPYFPWRAPAPRQRALLAAGGLPAGDAAPQPWAKAG